MTTMQVPAPRRATKAQRKARIALAGPSGGGKSFTALTIASSLPGTGRIVGIDTEKGSMADYADIFEFDHVPIDSYNPEFLIAMLAAYADDYRDGVLICDSLSHFWMGADGMLEQVDNATARSRSQSSFNSGWKDMRPVERRMIEALLAFPGHVIVTMRTKTEWVTEYDERTKKTGPRKIGTKPEQREGIEYEFGLVGDLDLDNRLVISKSRMNNGADFIRNGAVVLRPGPEFGKAIGEWLLNGVEVPSVPAFIERARAARTRVELRPVLEEVHRANLAGAVIRDNGRALTLRELIVEIGQGLPEDVDPMPDVEPEPPQQPAPEPVPEPRASADEAAEDGGGYQVIQEAADRRAAEPALSAVAQFAADWRADLAKTTRGSQLTPLIVRLERAKRDGSIDDTLAEQLLREHGQRLRAIRAGQ